MFCPPPVFCPKQFTPADLFKGNLRGGGFWDFTDTRTVFTDPARTTPSLVTQQIQGVTDKGPGAANLQTAATTITHELNGTLNVGRFPGGVEGEHTVPTLFGNVQATGPGLFVMAGVRPTAYLAAANSFIDADFLNLSNARVFQFLVNNLGGLVSLTWNDDLTNSGFLSSANGLISLGNPVVLSLLRTPTTEEIFINGISVASVAKPKLPQDLAYTCAMGMGASYAGVTTFNNQTWTGDIYAGVIIAKVPSAQQRQQCLEWFLDHAGI